MARKMVAALMLVSAVVVALGCGEDDSNYSGLECCRLAIICDFCSCSDAQRATAADGEMWACAGVLKDMGTYYGCDACVAVNCTNRCQCGTRGCK